MWNEHKIQIKGGRRRSPREIFFTSLLQDGPRGLLSDAPHNIASEQEHSVPANPFLAERPTLSQVHVEVPGCPLDDCELRRLDGWLQARIDSTIRCMSYRKSVWVDALNFCSMPYASDSS